MKSIIALHKTKQMLSLLTNVESSFIPGFKTIEKLRQSFNQMYTFTSMVSPQGCQLCWEKIEKHSLLIVNCKGFGLCLHCSYAVD